MTNLRAHLQRTIGASYTLERELGGGGMSRVFLAEETTLGRKVVVKVLPPDLIAGVNIDRFRREIQVSARLQHPHIVPVLTTGETDGVPYYTMPFVEGASLRARIEHAGPLPLTEAIGALRDVAKALAYAHERGVVHRDIKPDNVMIAGGSATVLDFGIAKAISASRTQEPGATLTQVGTSIGTPAYMAPEQAAGDPATDHRADLYSFACMAYEVLTGRPPFTATTPHRLMAAHLAEAPVPLAQLRPETPAPLAELVMRCLAKDPDARPSSAGELVAVLETVTSGSEHSAVPRSLLGGAGMLKQALLAYLVAFAAVAILAKAAIVAIGLPDWVFPGALIVMALGLPVILATGWVHHTVRRVAAMTPQRTPGGGSATNPSHGTMATLALKAGPHMSWRRTTLGGAYAIAGFVLLVGGFMVLRALGIGPAGSLLAAGTIRDREPLLVTDFAVRNADSTLGRVLSDAAKTQLAQSSVITLLPPEGIADALRRMTQPVTARLDLPLARELALRNGIRAIVDGEITGIGDTYLMTMKLVTTDSARELASFRQTASNAAGLIEAVDALARQLRGKLGESLKRVNAAPHLASATTGSLDALRKYTEGARAQDLLGDNARAIELLREAVVLDTAFAEAWRKLGTAMSNGFRPRAQIDSAFAAAFRHRHRVSENARDMIVAGYYSNGPGRDRGKAIAAYEAILRRGDTALAGNNVAIHLMNRREFARAESLLTAQLRLDPLRGQQGYGNLVFARRRLQMFDSADSLSRDFVVRFPSAKAAQERARIEALYRRGDTARFRAMVDSVYAHGDSADRGWARGQVQGLAFRDGQVARGLAMRRERRPPNPTARQRLGFALDPWAVWMEAVQLGEPQVPARRLDEALASFRGPFSPNDYFNIATMYAWSGRPDRARAWLGRFETDVRDTVLIRDSEQSALQAMGHILIAEERGVEAADAFRRADRRPDGPASPCIICIHSNLARAYDRAGMADSALKHYESYVTTYDWDHQLHDQFFLGVALKRLGELYEQRGDVPNAAKYYRDFANLWKNADAELQPQVAEARWRLRRLADIER